MSNVIATGNKIGQTIAFTRMLGGFCVASCLCSCAGMIVTDKTETDKRKKMKSATMLILFAILFAVLSYISYAMTKSIKGVGSLVAANAAIGAAFG